MNKVTTYKVWDHTKNGKVFATEEEAIAYSNDYLKRTRCVVLVSESKRKPTHIYNLSKKTTTKGRQ